MDWKESELERWLDLGRLIPRQWVEWWNQYEKILILISALDSSEAFCSPGSPNPSTHCLHAALSQSS